ncbi:MAG: sigma-70 family RNA polymerase sigma factor [Verrucomicrobiota bacterium]
MNTTQPTENRGLWLRDAVQQYEGSLLRYTHQFTGDLETARDVVQESFIKLCRQKPDKVGDPPGAWLYRVCRNRALDIYRGRIRRKEVSDESLPEVISTEQGPEADSIARDRREIINQLLKELSPQQQEIVRLKFIDELSYREIAEVTGLKTSNVGVHLHTALKRLREKMNDSDTPQAWKETLQP